MFDELKTAENNSGLGQISRMPKSQVDDIFAETDQEPEQRSAVPPRPVYNQAPPVEMKAAPAGIKEMPIKKKKGGGFKTFLFILIILILILVAAYFVYTKMMAANNVLPVVTTANPEETVAPLPTEPIPPVVEENVPAIEEEVSATSTGEVSPFPVVLQDSDSDGLLDQEEAEIGTNPMNPDSDSDGLNDALEIKVYSTNPLNPDSDSDGYSDGAEVQSGYNPNGAGKIQ